MSLVSVVIPVYNREKELDRAIRSVLKQTHQDFEVIIVDDFSSVDISAAVLQIGDKRISYHRLDKKGNANIGRNLGITKAKGEFVAMLDSDDEWLPNHLEQKLKVMREKDGDGVFGSCLVDDGAGHTEKVSRPPAQGEKMINYLLSGGVAPTPTHVYKTSCARQIMWDENLKRHQDWDFSVRFATRYSFVCDPSVTCVVHWKKGEKRETHHESLISFIESQKQDIQPKLYARYYSMLYDQLNDNNDPSGKMKALCRKAIYSNIRHMSLVDYLSVFGSGSGRTKSLLLRLDYARRVLVS